jgi:hypothetical protein
MEKGKLLLCGRQLRIGERDCEFPRQLKRRFGLRLMQVDRSFNYSELHMVSCFVTATISLENHNKQHCILGT